MGSLTIRVSRSTHDLLRELATAADKPMGQIVDEAIRDYRTQRFWAEYAAAYAALHDDPVAAADFRRECEAWDVTLADGLEEPPDGPDDRRKGSSAR